MAAEYLSKLGLRPLVYENPPLYESFWFEKIDGNEWRIWTKDHLPMCAVISTIYLLFVYYGPLWMKNRKPFNLQLPLVLWNFLLAIFSMVALIRLYPEINFVLKKQNWFHKSACEGYNTHHAAMFWGFAFTVSKVAELVDTVFIVLRKKPLIFLHWFHHLTMVTASFYAFTEAEPHSRYICIVNYFIHSIMYSYYAVKALRIRVPKSISMMITSSQILQFVSMMFVNLYTIIRHVSVGDCYRTTNSIIIHSVLGGAYLYLFVTLFYKSYIAKSDSKKD